MNNHPSPPYPPLESAPDKYVVLSGADNSNPPEGDSFYDISPYTYQECGLYHQLSQRFIADNPGDMMFERRSFVLSKDTHNLYTIVAALKSCLMEGCRAVMPFTEQIVILTGKFDGWPVFIWVGVKQNPQAFEVTIDMLAHAPAVKGLAYFVDKTFIDARLAVIKWHHLGRHGDDSRDFYPTLTGSKLHPEFYPDLGDPHRYLDEYMASDEAILLIAGPPGTGKTTLLRHLICEYKLIAHVIYDENIMKKDTVFQSFLFDDKKTGQTDIMIIEDADTILTDRQDDGNKLMSRFLNVSDGLIKLPNKKLVFTTNITDFNKVDQALLRPGRCFGVMHTRPLNLTEAQTAAKVAGLPIPDEKEVMLSRQYTLAELFNQGKKVSVRTIGFGARH